MDAQAHNESALYTTITRFVNSLENDVLNLNGTEKRNTVNVRFFCQAPECCVWFAQEPISSEKKKKHAMILPQ